MATRLTGVRFIDLGEEWRKAWTSGTPIPKISLQAQQNPQTISRAIWLAKIPIDIKQRIKSYPDVFTRTILLDTFAAKRRQCEKDGFALLRSEVERLIALGAGAKPKLKKTNKLNKSRVIKKPLATQESKKDKEINEPLTNPTFGLSASIEAEYLLKQALGYHCRVAFDKNGSGEVRIFFKDKKALEGLIETLAPFNNDLF